MNFTSFSVHHDSDGEAFLLIESSNTVDNGFMPFSGTMAHVKSRDIHSTNSESFKLFEAASGGSHSADKFGPPGATEAVFLQFCFRYGVNLDGAQIRGDNWGSSVVIGEGELRSGGGTHEGKAATGEREFGRWEVVSLEGCV